MWSEVGAGPLAAAMAVLQAADSVLQERWQKNEASVQRNIDPSLMNNPYMQEALAFDATQERVTEAVRYLEEARAQIIERENKMEEYREGTIKGASRAIIGIKVSIVVLSAAAGGEGAGFAGEGAGLFAKGAAAAGTSGFIGASTEFFTQVGEMRIGEREDFDFGKIAKRGITDTVTGFVGAVAGGGFSKVLGGKYTKWVYGLSEAELAGQGLTREMLLSKGEQLVIDWVAGVGASPFTTTAKTTMDIALGEKSDVHSFGDFAGKVWDDMEQGGALDALLKFAGTRVSGRSIMASGEGGGGSRGGGGIESTSTPSEGAAVSTPTDVGGGGGSSPPTTSTPEGTGGGNEAVPEHIGPEGDAYLSPDVSTGVVEPIGSGYEPTQPQNSSSAAPTVSGTDATQPMDTAVPEHIGPEGDAPLSPDLTTGVVEPVGPGYESTQPAVPGIEPTQPVDTAVPQPVGPEGDAYYSPDVAKNGPNGPARNAQNGGGGGGSEGGGSGGRPRRETLPGMGPAGPAGENAPPRRDTQPMESQEVPGDIETMPTQETAGDTTPMPAQQEPRRFSDTSELVDPINRAPENRSSVSGYAGSLPPGYGVFRSRVQLASGEVVNAVVKIYPGENAAQFNNEVAGAQAAAATGRGPEFYGQVQVPTGPEARKGVNDLAFAMEPVEGAFAFSGSSGYMSAGPYTPIELAYASPCTWSRWRLTASKTTVLPTTLTLAP